MSNVQQAVGYALHTKFFTAEDAENFNFDLSSVLSAFSAVKM